MAKQRATMAAAQWTLARVPAAVWRKPGLERRIHGLGAVAPVEAWRGGFGVFPTALGAKPGLLLLREEIKGEARGASDAVVHPLLDARQVE